MNRPKAHTTVFAPPPLNIICVSYLIHIDDSLMLLSMAGSFIVKLNTLYRVIDAISLLRKYLGLL